MDNTSQSASQPAEEPASVRKRKRPRAIQACERCRLKKYKCNDFYPCFHCQKSGLECVYSRGYRPRDDSPNGYVRSLELKIEELTARLNEKEDIRSSQQPPAHSSSALIFQSDDADTPGDSEVADVNQHTRAIEFHGSTSSIAFLGHVQKLRIQHESYPSPVEENSSLISVLHNHAFRPKITSASDPSPVQTENNFYFKQAHVFMDAYFSGIHFVHPFIDKEDFVSRANDLWFGCQSSPDTSFVALYLSLLSLGAIIRTWDEEQLDGLTRFEWSRKLFNEAQTYLNKIQFLNNLETVQCLYLMASRYLLIKLRVSYMYLGLAVRTCLSAGFNRSGSNPNNDQAASLSKTWWGIFSLEIEMSFSLGRPDSLGMDEYHNRPLPEIDDSEYAIIPCMVKLARIVRKVSVGLYHSTSPVQSNIALAFQIEQELDSWLLELPPRIQPSPLNEPHIGNLREPKWCRRQRLVLEVRYHNIKMLLFRPFVTYFIQNQAVVSEALTAAVDKCLVSAKRTIQVIYDTFRVHVFFRTWWYNTTYVMFAATIILLYVSRAKSPTTTPLIEFLDMAVEILGAMDESVVAKNSAEIIKRHLNDIKCPELASQPAESSNGAVPLELDMVLFSWVQQYQGLEFLDYSFEDLASLFVGLSEPVIPEA
ncbi:hypothetical protein AJ80_08925 [Polytolypa hystricis UAMH7299]|uniref:Zn(2)-C6 fungal-type domain-containing protein n=1 Tax=Polytolypa hystricis (strain UAMH7299) TaxID=1447883 RepID=A0A2B7WZR5_POLH7|nr:hypothetical protein AJ80_08925 [Polytolypa hystricis UAMH7299]